MQRLHGCQPPRIESTRASARPPLRPQFDPHPGNARTGRNPYSLRTVKADSATETMSMEIRPFRPEDEDAVVLLWRRCELIRPANNPRIDIHRKMSVRPDLFLVGVMDGAVVASVLAGYEGHRGWLNYLAVAPEHQHRGLARAIVEEAEKRLRDSGCPKVNLQIRTTNRSALEFYRRLGYSEDDVVSMGKRLVVDPPDQ